MIEEIKMKSLFVCSPPPPQMPVFPRPPPGPGPVPPFPQFPPFPSRPVNFFAGRLRNDLTIPPNYITDLLQTVNVSNIDPGNAPKMSQICADRYFCEMGRLGSKPQRDQETADFLQKILWKIAIEYVNNSPHYSVEWHTYYVCFFFSK